MSAENPNARMERLLALLLIDRMKDESMTDKSLVLTRVGFSSPEIAEMLGTTRLVVNQLVYVARKGKGSKKAGAKRSGRIRLAAS
jgi:hypothetical protein